MSKTSHLCAARGCLKKVPGNMLMCRTHWYLVPKAIRDRVWDLYQKAGRGDTIAKSMHMRACHDAVKSLEAGEAS